MIIIDRFRGEYAFLSNFNTCFEHGKSVEHFYQASKAINSKDYLKIINADSPVDAKRLSKTIQIRPDWDSIKLTVMEELLRRKFIISKFSTLLLATGNAMLIEGNSHGDTFWGICDNIGHNHLGRLLMKTRDEFLSNEAMLIY